ncbi:6-phosphogluconolactonase [uncultured Thiohalocapsa sp.]|uniref:6-phosphogluconolactonase n=1 Tax=uncultured Thiohalocapsa sp. TaxID=768990 RepID=UPI0025ED4BF5|nr:6-phosphogluconolactonase [uncultured Thiohalocapsa sp.]
MQLTGVETHVLADADAVAAEAARLILEAGADAITARGAFRLVLAGGSTPLAAYRLLAQAQAHWSRWHLYHGDERCLPPDAPERNSRAADEAWLAQIPIPRQQVHVIPAEQGAEAASAAYEPVVAEAVPFDLVLLGMGEDGHTASLFPGHEVCPGPLVMPVHDAPKPPPNRVSLTPSALCRSRRMLVLATGTGKQAAVARWQAGEGLPVARVAVGGNALVLLDRAAAPTHSDAR